MNEMWLIDVNFCFEMQSDRRLSSGSVGELAWRQNGRESESQRKTSHRNCSFYVKFRFVFKAVVEIVARSRCKECPFGIKCTICLQFTTAQKI